MAAPSGQDLLHDGLCYGVRVQLGHDECGPLIVPLEQGGGGVAWMNTDGAHARRIVYGLQFGGETLVESQGTGLAGTIVDHVGDGEPGGEGGDGDDHAVVGRDHMREERLDDPEVGKGVDVEGEADVTGAGVEESLAAGDTGIVDDDGGVADFAANLVGDRVDALWRSEIALVVVDI